MRHFTEELRSNGWNVTYEITEDFEASLKAWTKKNSITELRVITPNDRPFVQMIGNLNLSCQVTFIGNNHFMWSEEDFQEWAKSQKSLLMENFYRAGRKCFNILMADQKPIGGEGTLIKKIVNQLKVNSRHLKPFILRQIR